MVTVNLLAYNEEKYIKETLETIVNQTYQDMKIVVGDNHSTDNTTKIVKDFIANGNPIHLVENTENIGFGNALKLSKLSTTEYITIYHTDDIYDSDIVKEEITACEKYNLDACFTDIRNFYPDGHTEYYKREYLNKYLTQDQDIYLLDKPSVINDTIRYGQLTACPTMMIRKSVFEELGGFEKTPALNSYYNADTWLEIKLLKHNYRIGIIPKPMISYRISEEQWSSISRRPGSYNPYYDDIDWFINNNPDFNFDKRTLADYYKRKTINICNCINYNKKCGDSIAVEEFTKKLKDFPYNKNVVIKYYIKSFVKILIRYDKLKNIVFKRKHD